MPRLEFLYKPVTVLVIALIAVTSNKSFAQFYNLPNDYSFSLLGEKQLAFKDSTIHSGLKPYIHFFSPKYGHVADSHRVFKYITDDPALELIFYKHFLRVEPKKEKFKLRVDPLLNLEFGMDFIHKEYGRLYTNTRGVIAKIGRAHV